MSWYIGAKNGYRFCGSETSWHSDYVRKDCVRSLVLSLSKHREVDEVWKLTDCDWNKWDNTYEQLQKMGKLMWKNGVLYV